MIKSLLIKVKKFFAIVFSFLFGFLFRKEQKEDDRKDQDIKEDSYYHSKNKKDSAQFFSHSEKPSNVKDINYQEDIKRDLQKIFNIVKVIEKLEIELKYIDNEDDVELLQNKLIQVKEELIFLKYKYEKTESNTSEIKEIKNKIDTCNQLVKGTEEKVKKIEITKDLKINEISKKELLKKEIETSKNKDSYQDKEKETEIKKSTELESVIPSIIVEEKEEENENVTIREKSEEKEKIETPKVEISAKSISDSHQKDSQVKNIRISSIIIKEETDLITNKKIISQENRVTNNNTENAEQRNKESKKEEKKKNKVVIIEKNSPRTYSVNLSVLKQKIANLKTKSKVNKISSYLKKASKLTATIGILLFAKNNKADILATSIVVNNQIRKARRVNRKNVRLLKYKNVLKKMHLSHSIDNQIHYVINDTLSQIKKLRQELSTINYLDDEIIRLLGELDEIEINIKNNIEKMAEEAKSKSK